MPQSIITVILPVYQLAGRGLDRVQRSLYSIALNTIVPPVIVMDGSRPDQFAAVATMTRGFPFVQHIAHPLQRFNMPVLFNRGIEQARTPYLFCTGADFLYRKDFFATLGRGLTPNSFVTVPVQMLPECEITEEMVATWRFPEAHPNTFGGWADGLQCFHRQWYDYAGGYDERMVGWGGMDNDHHFRARRHRLACRWLAGTEVLHIWHPGEKVLGPDSDAKRLQTQANWKLRDSDVSIVRNRKIKQDITYTPEPGHSHKATVIVKDDREKIQSLWLTGSFYETQRHGMLNVVYRRFQGGVFLDAGAAMGNHTLFFAICCEADHVFAFEPVKELYDHLLENVAANGLSNVTSFNVALGDRTGEVGLAFSSFPPEAGGTCATQVVDSGTGVPLHTLDELLAGQPLGQLKCIKVDVEHYGIEVLRGARWIIEAHHPAIFCECATADEFAAVDEYLSALGYEAWCVQGKPFAMNDTATYLWERPEKWDLAVIITTYNRPESLRQLIEGLMTNTHNLQIRCLVYDDHSDTPYADMPDGSENFHISYARLPKHHGKTGYWQVVDRAYRDLRDVDAAYYMQLPDDVHVRPGFVRHAIATYQAINDAHKMALNLYLDDFRIGKANWTRTLPAIERHNGTSVFRIGWTDLCFIAEKRYFEALSYRVDPVPASRWQHDSRLSSGVGLQITERLAGQGLYQVRECHLDSADLPSHMNPRRPQHVNLATTQLEPIICGVASVSDRAEYLSRAIRTVLPFVDELHVYLNNYETAPDFLKEAKIAVHRSQDHGDLGDAGKFFAAGTKQGYYFVIDDDILYPQDFVWRLVSEIRQNRRAGIRAAVGIHGKVMAPKVSHYYTDHQRMYHSTGALDQRQVVHVIGTCALAYHTSDLRLSIADFPPPRNMADIHFSIACQKQDVACIVLPRPKGYLQILPVPTQKTIWGRYHSNDAEQTALYNSWTDWRLRG